MTTIYLLKCPDTHVIKYVGKSINIKRRYYEHTNLKGLKKRNTHLSKWLQKLLSDGKKPIIEVIEECENWQEREVYWIKYYRELGCNLCNLTDGGEGNHGYRLPKKHKDNISKGMKGKNTWAKGSTKSIECIEKIRASKIGGRNSHAKKIIDTCTGIVYDTLNAASAEFNLKPSTLCAMLKGQNKNKTNLKYYEINT